MEKTRKCYRYFICLSIFLGILFAIVFLRLHSGFEYPSQENLRSLLQDFLYPLIAGFVLSVSITIALKCIIDDLEWKLASLEVDIAGLNKKKKNLEIDK